ncbi:cell division protein FtsQ/DivIB [Luminiphilus sp.]|mgnify:CR=1 FL=1|jgi:cell division protein FtsQ|nr:cell division protein FtsQ/DivIB [Luminiphilus sp.]MDA8678805.1 cell division protein FtsQ/DivIB [Luminiphilus sp.]
MRKADPLIADSRTPAVSATKAVSTLRRWCNRLVLGCALTLLGVGLYQGVTALAAKQVKTLTVRGDVHHIDTDVIQARLTPRITDGFMAADLRDLRDELESLPWIYKVNTRRRWPAEIEVVLVEQRPLARWGDTGYLNHQGHFFAATQDGQYEHLPLLSGPEGAEGTLTRRYQMLASQLETEGLTIDELSIDALGQLSLKLMNGVQLALGANDLLRRVTRFKQLWSDKLSTQTVEKIDLRYEHGAAVTFGHSALAMQPLRSRGEG